MALVTLTCTFCKTAFDRKPTSTLPVNEPFCSRKCWQEHRTKWRCQICQIHVSHQGTYCKQHLPPKSKRQRTLTSYQSIKKQRQNIKIKAVAYKGGSCVKCGYNRCLRSLQFHHIDPTQKDFAISSSGKSWADILLELDKCVLVCSNCHGEIHDQLITTPTESGWQDTICTYNHHLIKMVLYPI
jgi:hypothetical protein